jgi:cyclase
MAATAELAFLADKYFLLANRLLNAAIKGRGIFFCISTTSSVRFKRLRFNDQESRSLRRRRLLSQSDLAISHPAVVSTYRYLSHTDEDETMKRSLRAFVTALALLSLTVITQRALLAPVTRPTAADDFQLVKVSEGIFAAVARPGGLASGNAGFVIGDDGVLIVDTFYTPTALQELISEIKAQTKLPIKFAVNTHYHLDHTGGNQVLAEQGVPIIAHDNVALWQTTKNRRFLPPPEELQKRKADTTKKLAELPADQQDKRAPLEAQLRRIDALLPLKLTNPTVTFRSGSIHLYLGKREVILSTLPGHTGGDVLAYVPDADVLFTGDMGWSRTLPNLVDATVNDWITSLDQILKEHPTAKFVPGHGAVATAAEIRDFRDYLVDLRSRVQQAISDGLTIEQAKTQLMLPDKYKSFAFQNFAQPNVEDMYKELKGTKNQ